jgi:hypothetical protein
VPALALALGSLVALHRHEAGEGRAWLGLAALQAAAVPWFKVFLGAQLALSLAVAALLIAWSRRRADALPAVGRRGPALAAAALAAVTGLALLPLVLGGTGEQVEVVVAPLRMVRESLRDVGLGGFAASWLLVATLPWLALSLGLRTLGLPAAWRSLFAAKAAPAAAAALALSGWPLGLLFHVGARARRPALVVAVAALLSLPSTLEFAWRKSRVAPDEVPAGAVRALDAIARDGRPGDVVLQRPGGRYPPLPAVLVGRRVVYERFTPYLTQFAPREELLRRHEALHRFFQTPDREEALTIARGFSGRYLCLYGSDRVRFDTEGILVPIHEEKDARAYRIVPAAAR